MSKRAGEKQAARAVREQLAKERRRKRTLWTSVIAAAALAIAGLVGWGIYAAQGSDSFTAPPAAVDDSSGIADGDGPVTIDVYEDFICPACKQFETVSGASLDTLANENKARVVYHPMGFLDSKSTTRYSTRAAGAAGCASDSGKYREFAQALFAQQPAEGSAGLTDDQLVQIGGSVGLVDPAFAQCVRDGRYQDWVAHVTDVASERGVVGTPTVFVDGKRVDQPTPDNLTNAVAAAKK